MQATDPRQITAAIRNSSTQQQLATVILHHIDSMNAICLSAAISKLSKIRCNDPQLYAACVQRYLQFAPDDTARGLSNAVYALCTARLKVMQQQQAAVQQQLVLAFLSKLASASAQGISIVLYGMARS